ncbi:uncharacterized protein LOC112459244, partial [Temnothorax curvispinosus]|uniref:Uncharacterized protein LOC112459244 n=1 Tax=Temnothorax curvispinosus TaxID=300111 RepID=A0A6J1Q9W4_9HYME
MYRRPRGCNFCDLNCNLLTSSYESNHLKSLASQLSLSIVQSQSTFHTQSSDSLLDVFIVDNLDKVSSFRKSDAPFINGHDRIELTYSFEVSPLKSRTLVRRSFKNFDEQRFIEIVSSKLSSSFPTDFSCECLGEPDIDGILTTITNDITSSLDLHAPTHTFRVTRPSAPWLTDALACRIKHRNRLYNVARRSHNILDFHIYRLFRNELTLDLRRA